jgi:hypothetical protein
MEVAALHGPLIAGRHPPQAALQFEQPRVSLSIVPRSIAGWPASRNHALPVPSDTGPDNPHEFEYRTELASRPLLSTGPRLSPIERRFNPAYEAARLEA